MVASIVFAGQAVWIQAKAELGQLLLSRAWSETLETGGVHKPWPWADTWPVAELTDHSTGARFIVLEGVSGEAMAFGPGRMEELSDTALSGVYGIGGHRDSHLGFTEQLSLGSVLTLRSQENQSTSYTVVDLQVADSADTQLQIATDQHALVLVTCYPFNAWQTGGSQRYVVTAEAIPSAPQINRELKTAVAGVGDRYVTNNLDNRYSVTHY